MTCQCGHSDHVFECKVMCLGIAPCGCTRLPPPTDDELLLAFVDNCPSMAINDYRHRLGLDWRLTPSFIHAHLAQEWDRRMNGKEKP